MARLKEEKYSGAAPLCGFIPPDTTPTPYYISLSTRRHKQIHRNAYEIDGLKTSSALLKGGSANSA